MTYQELSDRLKQLTPEQLKMNVTLKTPDDEYYGGIYIEFADVRTEDRLDGWHPYLTSRLYSWRLPNIHLQYVYDE